MLYPRTALANFSSSAVVGRCDCKAHCGTYSRKFSRGNIFVVFNNLTTKTTKIFPLENFLLYGKCSCKKQSSLAMWILLSYK